MHLLSRKKYFRFFFPFRDPRKKTFFRDSQKKREREREAKKKEKRFLFLSFTPLLHTQMPLPSPATRHQRPCSMLLMPLAVAAARRAATRAARAKAMTTTTASAASLYSMRPASSSPSHLRIPAARPAIRRPFAASASAIESSPRQNKGTNNRPRNKGQLGTPFKAAGGNGGGRASAASSCSALPSHCSGCGVSLQGSDPDLPG